jgi:hypothetical protein
MLLSLSMYDRLRFLTVRLSFVLSLTDAQCTGLLLVAVMLFL